jgi:F420-non-reducing hydrogenase iron-sulfur subunit
MCGCHIGDCHYIEGNKSAEKRASAISIMLEDFGIEAERFRLEWISASEAPKFAQVMREVVDTIKKLGPSPYS